jgi:hypothetical protein
MSNLERSEDQVICEIESILMQALTQLTPAQLERLREIKAEKNTD